MFVNSIEVFNRNIDPGPEWPLETEGAENWASSTERQDGLEASKEEIDALRSDTITDSQSLMLDLIDSIVEILKNNGGDEEEIVKAFYASPPMSAKSAAKQSDPVLVKAAAEAIQKEKANLIENEVLRFMSYSDIPEDYRNKVISSFVFVVNKMTSEGLLDKVKARIVCNGSQEAPDTYTRTASPVINKSLLFMMLQMLTEEGWEAYCMDVSAAFLKVVVPESTEIYIRTDPSLRDGTKYTTHARLLKYLYGLKASSYNFYIAVRDVLIKAGFECTQVDGGLFYLHEMIDGVRKCTAVIAVHVDDLFLMCKNKVIKDMILQKLVERFEDVKCENCKSYLGISISKDEDGNVYASIPGFLKTMGDHLDIQSEIDKYRTRKWGTTPWDGTAQNVELGKSEIKIQVKKFQQLLGILNYACNIRSECTIMVNMLASRQQDPRLDDYIACLRIIDYLRKTYELGITFRPIERINGKITLYCTADASYGLKKPDAGHTGATFSLGANGTPFHVICKRQATKSKSSTEAEIKAYNTCAAIISYFSKILKEVYLIDNDDPVIVEGDNMAAIQCVMGTHITPNLVHMENQYWYCRHMYQNRKIVYAWCPTKMLLADTLTKPLIPAKFVIFRKRLLGEPMLDQNNEEISLDRTVKFPNGHEQDIKISVKEAKLH